MKSRMAVVSALVCVGVFIQVSVASASGFSESLKEKLVCSSGSTCTVVRTGKFKVSGQVFVGQNLDASDFDPSSVVDVELGNLSFHGTLGDDPNYVAGAKSATFQPTPAVKIVLQKGSKGLKITVAGTISDTQSPVLAGNFVGTTGPINTSTSASVQLGSHIDSEPNLPIVGSASVKTVVKDGQSYHLSSVKIKSQ